MMTKLKKKNALTTIAAAVFPLLAFSVLAFSTLASAGPCFDQAKQFGRGKDKSDQVIDPQCIQKAMNQAATNARGLSESGALQAFGYANVLVVKKLNPLIERTIAGPSTELQNIIATAVDELNNEVFVYDDVKKSVFVFTTTMGGNLAPKRTLQLDGLNGVVSIAVDSKRDELFVALEREVAVFSRLANKDGKRAENSQTELRRLTGPQTGLSKISGITVHSQSERLFIRDANTVSVFETYSKGDTPPLRKFSVK